MNPATAEELLAILSSLYYDYGQKLTETQIKSWAAVLKGKTTDEIQTGITNWKRSSPIPVFPKPSDIAKHIPRRKQLWKDTAPNMTETDVEFGKDYAKQVQRWLDGEISKEQLEQNRLALLKRHGL